MLLLTLQPSAPVSIALLLTLQPSAPVRCFELCLSFALSVLSQPYPGHAVEKKAFNKDYEPDTANGNTASVGLRMPLRTPSVCPVSVSAKTKKPASASGGGFGGDSKTGTVTKTKKAGAKAAVPKAKKGRTLAKKQGNDDMWDLIDSVAKPGPTKTLIKKGKRERLRRCPNFIGFLFSMHMRVQVHERTSERNS